MFRRALGSLSLAAAIVVAGTSSSYGQTTFYRQVAGNGTPVGEIPKNPAVRQTQQHFTDHVRNIGQGLQGFGAMMGGAGILCWGTNCTGSPANEGNQPQPQYYQPQPQYYQPQPQYYNRQY